MKKNYKPHYVLCILMLAFSVLQVSGQNNVLEKNISINITNGSFEQVVMQIEKQSDVLFLYKSDDIDKSMKITIAAQNKSISFILNEVLSGTGLSYSLSGRHITIAKEIAKIGNSQSVRVSGLITDLKGVPIIGANISEKGTTNGTSTGSDGRFKMTLNSSSQLQISYLGYLTQVLPVGNRTVFNIRMDEDSKSMDEVVVIGYGTAKKSSLTGSVATIKSDELTVAPVANTSNALAGRLPGLIAKQQSGLPGSDGAVLSIRGFDGPLVIVDGVENNFSNIDPNEIESISILKDASAAVYGARAGNGVVLVTTKRGKEGKPTITVNSTFTFQNPMQLMKMASAGQYTEMVREAHIQSGQPESTSRFSQEQIDKYYAGTDPDYPSTDWFDYLIRDWTPQQQHNISLRGGSDRIKYYGFFGFLDQESMIKRGGGNYMRYNVRTNIDAKVLDNLTMTVDFSTIIENRRFPWRNDENNDSVWADIWNTEPIYPATLPDGSVPYANGGGTGGAHISSNRNLSGTRDTDNQTMRAQGSLKWDINQVPGLSAKANFVLDKWFQDYKYFQSIPDTYTYNYAADQYTKIAKGLETKLDQSASKGQNITAQFSLNYDQTFGDHSVAAMVLYEMIDQSNSWISAGRSGFDTNTIPYLFAGGLKNQIANGSAGEMGRSSLISRVNYSYRQKYLLEATLRYDGSAKFDKDYRWGLFPSVSAAWRLSEEPFLKDNVSVIDNLKIRAGYSQTGFDNVANFNYLAGYKYGNIYNIGGSASQGLIASGMANPLLSWEEMTIYNVGVDFGLFKNHLFGEVDAFYRDRKGIPGSRSASLPDTFGENLPIENLNQISTRGFEFTVGYKGNTKDFSYDVSANTSWSRSKWEKYDEAAYTDPDGIRINQRTGKWTDVMFGYKSNGLFTSQDQIDELSYKYMAGSDNSFLKQGDVILLNTNGDDMLDWRDQVEIGKGSMPHWMAGLNVNLRYKNIDFSMLWQGAFGFSHQVVLERGIVKPEIMYKERWTYENNNANAIVPRLGGAATNGWGSDYNVIDGDYFRLKTLSLGYSLPTSWLQKVKIGSVRIFVAGTNLFTFSALNKYKIDPEAASGAGGYYYPQMRTVTIGLNITL